MTSNTDLTSSALLTELVTTNSDVLVVPLTVEEAKLIRSSFYRISDKLEEIGTASFQELFSHHPEAIKIFVNNRVFPVTVSEVKYSWELKGHALRVMHTFERIINRLDKPSTIWTAMISDIGCRHASYSAKPAYLPVLVAAFRHAFFKQFTEFGILTPELSDVWYKLFNNMTVLMTSAVVTSFIDQYASYKANPKMAPSWLNAGTPVNGELTTPNKSNSNSPLPPKNTRKSTTQNSQHGGKCPYKGPSSNLGTPAKGSTSPRSNSSRLRKRISDFWSFSNKISKAKSEGNNVLSPSSSGDEVQIINI